MAENLNDLSPEEKAKFEKAVAGICSHYGCEEKSVRELIRLTNGIGGVSFVKIKSYNSDKSDHTEVADQLINVGASYANMLTKDETILAKFDVSKVDVNAFNYGSIDTAGLSVEAYKLAVKAALPMALAEMLQPKKKANTSNDIYLNKALIWNENTMRLSVRGTTLKKEVVEEGAYKVVKSAPKTVAKRLIEKFADLHQSDLRRFAVDNLGGINLKGEVLEIGGGVGLLTE